jgi:hypothetical protein
MGVFFIRSVSDTISAMLLPKHAADHMANRRGPHSEKHCHAEMLNRDSWEVHVIHLKTHVVSNRMWPGQEDEAQLVSEDLQVIKTMICCLSLPGSFSR